jgi:hypothetical protein
VARGHYPAAASTDNLLGSVFNGPPASDPRRSSPKALAAADFFASATADKARTTPPNALGSIGRIGQPATAQSPPFQASRTDSMFGGRQDDGVAAAASAFQSGLPPKAKMGSILRKMQQAGQLEGAVASADLATGSGNPKALLAGHGERSPPPRASHLGSSPPRLRPAGIAPPPAVFRPSVVSGPPPVGVAAAAASAFQSGLPPKAKMGSILRKMQQAGQLEGAVGSAEAAEATTALLAPRAGRQVAFSVWSAGLNPVSPLASPGSAELKTPAPAAPEGTPPLPVGTAARTSPDPFAGLADVPLKSLRSGGGVGGGGSGGSRFESLDRTPHGVAHGPPPASFASTARAAQEGEISL